MKKKILIVEDQFVEADYLRMILTKAGYTVCEIARSVEEAIKIIEKEKPELVLLDIFLKGRLTGIDLAKQLKEDNTAFIYLSANSNEETLAAAKATEPYGFLVKPFQENNLMIALEIAFYRHEQSNEALWRIEMKVQRALSQVAQAPGTWISKLISTANALQQYISFDCLSVKFKPKDGDQFAGCTFLRTGFDEYQTIGIDELSNISKLTTDEIAQTLKNTPADDKAGWYNGADFTALFPAHPMKALMARTFGCCSNLVLPFLFHDNYALSLSFFRRIPEGYSAEKLNGLLRLQQSLKAVIDSITPEQKKEALSMHYLPTDSRPAPNLHQGLFKEIIGNSPLVLNVMDLVTQVASSDTSVLILGESGTGKEKIADCIHASSKQNGKPFIKINCAALPPSLIESELFGHEKGAFTGAVEKRIGKFEQADTGTIFLDEIGELPLDLQVKMLRVLQEKEVERVGSRSVLKINVRIIAATNRNLEKEVAAGKFRLDLYYRLNVFPIVLPPLRQRRDDIPALTSHFIDHFNRKTGKKISGVSERVARKFECYDWPGNIRELEHLIERGVLLCKGSIIEDINFPEFGKKSGEDVSEVRTKTMEENERDHILSVLKKCHGKIWGPGAAAEILNMPPSTLKSRMNKLGIKKSFID
ncbi:sigma 54-interacting transcriptional regulator [Mucilaginibacter sp.]|uniref:sigma 54-interacting transcriptional regulator n=1 Tax=Mucilaginibacter sp. TaxID=1882438 RepID=UPI0035BBFBF7